MNSNNTSKVFPETYVPDCDLDRDSDQDIEDPAMAIIHQNRRASGRLGNQTTLYNHRRLEAQILTMQETSFDGDSDGFASSRHSKYQSGSISERSPSMFGKTS